MSRKLTKEEIKAKKKFHDNRCKYYEKKLKALEKTERRIGFKHYD